MFSSATGSRGLGSVAEMLAPYVALGYRHLVAGFPADYDEETTTRFLMEVKPMLEKLT